jgi:adenine-specific DNA-methyltransferase
VTEHAVPGVGSPAYEKLKALLLELFQLDQPELDFGIYRVMHAKSSEIVQFLDRDLLPQVKDAFGAYKTSDKAELAKELARAIAQAKDLGADPESLPKVRDLRRTLAEEAVDLTGLENEVYDHLFRFFRRYYSEGDFLAKRVYKPGVFAIPYEGEEVTFHWANRDQYYIKTSEYLRDYAFRLRPLDDEQPMRVHFRLASATEGEHGNAIPTEGDRLFVPRAEVLVAEEEGELVVSFEYRPPSIADWPEGAREGKDKPPTQKDLITIAGERILSLGDAGDDPWVTELSKPYALSSGEPRDYSTLEAHLRGYTARNTYDYFIHKDLGSFLRRELDFYIKNEVVRLDDIESESAPRVEQYLSRVKVIRLVAGKVIDFIAQLEDFQKLLWLKRKFVVETNYCLTLGLLPAELQSAVAANDAQRQEWIELHGIDRMTGGRDAPPYSVPLTSEFLTAHPTLVVDTRHFDDDAKGRILASLKDLSCIVSGCLMIGDNFQAARLMSSSWAKKITCFYVALPEPGCAPGLDGIQHGLPRCPPSQDPGDAGDSIPRSASAG